MSLHVQCNSGITLELTHHTYCSLSVFSTQLAVPRPAPRSASPGQFSRDRWEEHPVSECTACPCSGVSSHAGFTPSDCFSSLGKKKPLTVKYSYGLSGKMLLPFAYLGLLFSIENGKKVFKIHKWLALIPLFLLTHVEHKDSKIHWAFFKICIGCSWVSVRRTTQGKVFNNSGGKFVYFKKKKK